MKPQSPYFAILALMLTGQAAAGIPVYRVGLTCEYPTIQAAVDAIPASGSGILRIRTGSYSENVFIIDKNVEMIGGYANCTATNPTEHGLSAIDASGSSLPALRFLVGGTRQLQLTSINLANGTGASDADIDPLNPFPGGGLSVWTNDSATASVILNRSAVFDNHSQHRGGGIALLGTGSGMLQLRDNSRIMSNTVGGNQPRGGGLYCQGDHQVFMWGGSINSNIAGGAAVGLGGGIHLDGCIMGWAAYQQTSSSADDASLRDNTAYGDGGGVYAQGGAILLLVGADNDTASAPSTRPLRVSGNQAINGDAAPITGRGGALFARGTDTSIMFDRAWIHDNHAHLSGGALYALEGAVVNVVRGRQRCHNPRQCSRVFDNTAQGSSVVFARDEGTQVNFFRTSIRNNPVGLHSSSLLYFADGANLGMIDSLLADFPTESGYAITLWNTGGGIGLPVSGTIVRSTIADTRQVFGVFRLTGEVTLEVQGSIIHDPTALNIVSVISGPPTVNTQCVMWHSDELAGLGSSEHTVVANPLFLDRDNGLYYLRSDSPAINFCSGPAPGPSQVDLNWSPRGLVHSGQPVQHGPYDLGAYELPLDIFKDRFEQ